MTSISLIETAGTAYPIVVVVQVAQSLDLVVVSTGSFFGDTQLVADLLKGEVLLVMHAEDPRAFRGSADWHSQDIE